jgi:hypothetical protein
MSMTEFMATMGGEISESEVWLFITEARNRQQPDYPSCQ